MQSSALRVSRWPILAPGSRGMIVFLRDLSWLLNIFCKKIQLFYIKNMKKNN